MLKHVSNVVLSRIADILPVESNRFLLLLLIFFSFTLLVCSLGENVVDQSIADWMYEHPRIRGDMTYQITSLGDGRVVRRLCWISAVMLWLTSRWRCIPFLFIAVVGGMEANHFLQDVLGRVRPSFEGIPVIARPSYPSGHTVAATTFLGFWVIVLIRETQPLHLREMIIAVLYAAMCLVAISRVALLAHWASDVIGGLLFSAIWLICAYRFNDRMWKNGYVPKTSRPGD